jgi:hypothetical protein
MDEDTKDNIGATGIFIFFVGLLLLIAESCDRKRYLFKVKVLKEAGICVVTNV